MVTHDQEEALTMADRILVMDHGRIVQSGTPSEVYNKPATPFVASFLGSMNFLGDAVKEASGTIRIGGVCLQVEDRFTDGISPGAAVTVAIRPEDVVVGGAGDGTRTALPARVGILEFRGPRYRVSFHLSLGNGRVWTIDAELPTEMIRRLGIQEDMEMAVHLPADRIRVYPL
jgi:iron(III) transport system ATP-binding protein